VDWLPWKSSDRIKHRSGELYAANDAGFGVAVSMSGSNGTMNGGTGATGNSTGTGNLNVTSQTGDMVFDMVAVGAGKTSPVAGAGQTARLAGDDSYWHDALGSDRGGSGHNHNVMDLEWRFIQLLSHGSKCGSGIYNNHQIVQWYFDRKCKNGTQRHCNS